MAADFSVKFLVNRTSGVYQMQITDASTGFTLAKANTKITFPDGVVVENTDYISPDISAPLGTVNKTLRLDTDNKVLSGTYKIRFTALDASPNTYTIEKTFTFDWVEPSIDISNTSDVVIPEVKFKDATVGYDQTSYTESIATRQLDVDFPSTSDVSGSSITESNTSDFGSMEADMVDSTNYYEGIYNPVLTTDVTYTSTTNTYLTVQWIDDYTEEFDVRKARSRSELLTLINNYKDTVDTYKSTNIEQFQRLTKQYKLAVSLFSHIVDRYSIGLGDGSEPSLDELLAIVDNTSGYTYQSTPISAFDLGSGGGVTIHSALTLDDGTNPHNTTASDVGLGNVDNTSDVNKPISSATQTALNNKLESSDLLNYETSTELNTRDTNNRNRANHTGTQTSSTISDFDSSVTGNTVVKRSTTSAINALGTNPTAADANSEGFYRATATYTASTTLTFSNVTNLTQISLQITNTNANVITFSGVTLYFKADDLPDGVTFAANALTFPADSAVKYNLVGEKFDGSTFDCKIEIR